MEEDLEMDEIFEEGDSRIPGTARSAISQNGTDDLTSSPQK